MSITDRTAASGLIPEQFVGPIIQGAEAASAALQLFQRGPTMTRKQTRMPVLAALPSASFVTGSDTDTGFKPVTLAQWKNKYLNAEPVAAIVPVPEDVVDDVDYDLWGEMRPKIAEAIGKAIDAAVFFGAGKPSTWPTSVYDAAVATGQNLNVGDNVDIAEDINQAMALVEQWGYEVTGHGAAPTLKATLRGLRDAQDRPIFVSDLRSDGGQNFAVYGYPTFFFKNGAWDRAKATLITGDYQQGILSFRQDISYKVLSEATLYGTGINDPQYALAQQDMVALRVVARVAWQVANPLTQLSGPGWSPTGVGTDTYPFAVLEP